jgi:hypothetical protein
MSRSWEAFAQAGENNDYITIDTKLRMMRFRGCKEEDALPVTLVEDPDGLYWGWIDAKDDKVSMIRREVPFKVQFPGGYAEKVERGFGEVVRLRIERKL